LAASIIACEALIESGMPIPGALEISGTVDEESGGFAGVVIWQSAVTLASRVCTTSSFLSHWA